jgi:2-dehydropantoate 2-reductase
MSSLRIGVFGAGAIGCYVGGRLAAAGADVVFVGRDKLGAEIAKHGLTTTDLDGSAVGVPKGSVAFETNPAALGDRDVVLVCVKSAQTAETAVRLAAVLRPQSILVSMQNGVRNADVLREHAPKLSSLGGIVGFNVVSKGDGNFRRATSGPLVIEASADSRVRDLARALSDCGFEVEVAKDIRAMQWSKLVMNLNNAVSALSDAPTKQIVLTPGYRRCVAVIVAEALGVMRAAKIRPKRIGPLPVHVFPYALRLPTPLIRVVARAQLKIDPEARSSMWEDLSRGRTTEVDYLNGEIVRLAKSIGKGAPINQRVVDLVHDVEAKKSGSPKLSPDALYAALIARA